jgi:Sec-independent protein translocase protein TatA
MEYEALSSSILTHGAFWVLVAILIFIVLFGAKIAGPLARALDNRADTVRQSLDEAAKLKAEAEALLADARKKRTQALAEAKDILARAHEEAARTAAELLADAEMRARRSPVHGGRSRDRGHDSGSARGFDGCRGWPSRRSCDRRGLGCLHPPRGLTINGRRASRRRAW